MPNWVYGLAVFGALAVAGDVLGAPAVLVFAAACVGLVPLAGLIGLATGQVAARLGPQWGGLLNATFGNAAELIITLLALREGHFTLVKASITGSIVGNTLLVLGMALVVGGWRHGVLRFDLRPAGLSSALMILAVAGLLLPAVFTSLVRDATRLEQLSVVVAVVLLLSYAAYLLFLFRGERRIARSARSRQAHDTGGQKEAAPGGSAEAAAGTSGLPEALAAGAADSPRHRDTERAGLAEVAADAGGWSLRRGLFALGAATVGTALVSDTLVNTVTPVTAQLGWTELFLGVIVIPIVGNAAENWAAVRAAARNHVDLTLSITSGSSTQIPLFVAPVLIFVSLAIGHPMTLVFDPLELLVLALATAISAYIALDGESHWLEGVLLLALYVMTAGVFFLDPSTV